MPILGASQPSNGLAEEGRPAFTLKLCKSRSAFNDFRYRIFSVSLSFIHDGVRLTAVLEKGKTWVISLWKVDVCPKIYIVVGSKESRKEILFNMRYLNI
jgi:hypothetical protein